MAVIKSYIRIAIALCLFACSHDQVSPIHDRTVHLAGYLGTPDLNTVASYWKDGAYTNLTHDTSANDNIASQVTSLYIDGLSVLIGGRRLILGSRSQTLLWKDGNETVIGEGLGDPLIASRDNNLVGVWVEPDPPWKWMLHKNGSSQPIIDTALNIGPSSLALLGDDVYIGGCSIGIDHKQHAQYWKDGQLIFRESKESNAMSISIHRNDIYLAGYLWGYGDPTGIACYWKNGQRVNLTDGKVHAIARSIFVTDEHVYVSGVIDQQAVYWKDGEATVLTNGSTLSMANCIFVQEGDVHVGGYEESHPAYWKNDVKQNIENQDQLGKIKFIVVGSN